MIASALRAGGVAALLTRLLEQPLDATQLVVLQEQLLRQGTSSTPLPSKPVARQAANAGIFMVLVSEVGRACEARLPAGRLYAD